MPSFTRHYYAHEQVYGCDRNHLMLGYQENNYFPALLTSRQLLPADWDP